MQTKPCNKRITGRPHIQPEAQAEPTGDRALFILTMGNVEKNCNINQPWRGTSTD